jgi:hypothetical protein
MTREEINTQAKEIIKLGFSYLKQSEAYDDFEGTKTRTVYLGTVFGIMPSGKYYEPYANSNVDACPRCKGTRKFNGQDCPYCEGMGSREALEDDWMHEALMHHAAQHGCFVSSGEGNPCDIFLSQEVEEVV